MTPLEIILEAQKKPLTTEDGDADPLELAPPLSEDEISAFEAELPCKLPREIRELLSRCSGFTGGAVDFVDFTGQDCSFGQEEVFPHGLPIAADGFGNFWVIDLLPTSKTWGPIYFACHDAPVILYQSPGLSHFLIELFKMSIPPYKSLVDDVHEDRLFDVWWKNPGVMSCDECVKSADVELEELRNAAWAIFPDYRHAHPRNRFRILLGQVRGKDCRPSAWQHSDLRLPETCWHFGTAFQKERRIMRLTVFCGQGKLGVGNL